MNVSPGLFSKFSGGATPRIAISHPAARLNSRKVREAKFQHREISAACESELVVKCLWSRLAY